ncbi:MAG: TIGR04372 family glycosyltransferase [Alphaproteobacteria bacterium]|nr:TIGR04372 family glycosyltransferase [Alphaproteobacteria bacterium]
MSELPQTQSVRFFPRIKASAAHFAFMTARKLIRLRLTSWLILVLAPTKIGIFLMVKILGGVDPQSRPQFVKAAQKLSGTKDQWDEVIARATQESERHAYARGYVETLILALIGGQYYKEILTVLTATDPETIQQSAVLRNARTFARFQVANFPGTVEAARDSFRTDPKAAATGSDCLYGSYAAGQLRDFPTALELFAAHFDLVKTVTTDLSPSSAEDLWEKVAHEALSRLKRVTVLDFAGKKKTGLFFLSSTQALGHSILDPYYFLSLSRGIYDRVIFVGPPLDWYENPPAVSIEILRQYGDYVETTDQMLINLSWMSFGAHAFGNIHLNVSNYWSLVRDAALRDQDPSDPYIQNGWHVSVPAAFESEGRKFAARHGIDLSRPIVTVNTREISYHNLSKQSFRDVDVHTYTAGILRLVDRGYQVIRIGDARMTSLSIDSPQYMELPFAEGYSHLLDSYFISRSSFMIGCQSGPCAFARAFGIPLLSINAVLHYTLLPAPMEMALFKHYVVQDSDGRRHELEPVETLERNLFWLEDSMQFIERGITLHNASSEEIEAAVTDMIAWLDDPDLPMTESQQAFHDAAALADRKARDSTECVPVTNYLGIALPGYRIAPHRERIAEG